jgi:GAF domain-containing protein
VLQAKHPIHIVDIKAEPAYAEREPSRVATVEIAEARTFLAVPMLRDDQLIGVIAIYRQEVRPFSTMQIEPARTLADHASIAIESTRLLGELGERTRDLGEALEYQTTVSDVLKVINRSAFDLQTRSLRPQGAFATPRVGRSRCWRARSIATSRRPASPPTFPRC